MFPVLVAIEIAKNEPNQGGLVCIMIDCSVVILGTPLTFQVSLPGLNKPS